MAGIVSFGAYIPRLRLSRKLIHQAMGWFNPATASAARGERAVANHDEDSLTLLVAAGRDALAGRERTQVDGLVVASTSLPYAERQNGAIAAAALDLPEGARTTDLGGSTRSGTSAVLAGLDAVAAGSCREVLVAAADCRQARSGSRQEHLYGDAGAALLLGDEGCLATLVASASVHADLGDLRRPVGEEFPRLWEERWARDEGPARFLRQAAQECLRRADVAPAALARVVVAGADARLAGALLKKLGLPPDRLQDNLASTVGDAGAALPLLLLAAALEQAAPAEDILVLSYSSGADALLFRTTDRIADSRPARGVAGHLARRSPLESYEKLLAFRRLLPLELGIRGETVAPTALSVLWRNRRAFYGLYGHRCTRCGTPHFPPLRTCVVPGCGAVDEFSPYPFADRTGTLFTYTSDNLAFSVDPPALYGLVDYAGGGRLFLDLTDCRAEELAVGLSVEPTFRRKYLDPAGGVHGYFWKACPCWTPPDAASPRAH